MAIQNAKFVQGSTMRHVLIMSGSSSVGLIAIFLVDFLDMLFISMLRQDALNAAVGYAGTLLFFSTSASIGTAIAMGAMVSKAIGGRDFERARQLSGSIYITAFIISLLTSALMLIFLPQLLTAVGASGVALEKAKAYLYIILPSAPFLAIGIASNAGLRAVGDAKRSMYSTLAGAAINAILDPIFIFYFKWNMEGAALASLISRFTVLAVAIYPFIKIHKLVKWPCAAQFKKHLRPILGIAGPAIIANMASPVGNAIVTASMAKFGQDYVAGLAVVGRLTPMCFAVIFALSGAIGPIIGQNFGAQRFDRVKQALNDSLLFATIYVFATCILLYLLQPWILSIFSLTGNAAMILTTFCTTVSIAYIFNAALFVANASFNNLGKPLYSTALNLSRASIGTVPFVILFSDWFGAVGVLYGQAAGFALFGIIGVILLKLHLNSLDSTAK